MSNLVRCSLSIEKSLFDQLERLVTEAGYENRSEFVRDLIRNHLVREEWEANEEALATITMVYDHETRNLERNLTHMQHDHHDLFLATTHVHLDAHLCAEMIMLKGNANEIRHIASALGKQKGVLHTSLSISSTGKKLK
ncbi:nickel-responsive transcriptional regulator NikR [Myxococcota bacterium]|nr:nickel-responsive transcriptional regulator NikR [Myxococcota bacterium]MBU1379411.1 nickel-responsive transcriptional regulator NikR [Myxococcota bacterium]MBU1495357.1 nickel-responsive transcriptional regulator NikR [Myxococcota bacterium]